MNRFISNKKVQLSHKKIKYKMIASIFAIYLIITNNYIYPESPLFEINASQNPPYVIKQSQNTYVGISMEIIQEAFKISNLKYHIIDTSEQWKRAITPESKNTIFILFRTPEREDKYKWIEPLYEDKSYIFYNKNKIKKLEPLSNYNAIGTLAGGAAESILKSLGLEEKIYLCKSDIQCLELLKSNEIDVWIGLGVKSKYYIKNGNLENSIMRGPFIYSGKVWLVSSPEISDENRIILKKAISKFLETKKYREILKKYGALE